MADFPPRVAGPDRSLGQCQLANGHIMRGVVVTALVLDNLVARALQQVAFVPENGVFAPRLLVRVVSQDYFHETPAPATQENSESASSSTWRLPGPPAYS